MASGLRAQQRRTLAWVAALGAAGLAAAVTLSAPVTAADESTPEQAVEDIGYALPEGWTDTSQFLPQFVAHTAPMCFYQGGDPSKCYVQILPAAETDPSVAAQVGGMIGPCLPDRAAPQLAVLGDQQTTLGGHASHQVRWAATCPSGDTMVIQADEVSDLGLVVWSHADSLFGQPVDNDGVRAILDSLTFSGDQ